MNILLIEDDDGKSDAICNFIYTEFFDSFVDRRKSFQSGLNAVMNNEYSHMLLDMTLPTYDVTEYDSGYDLMTYAGKLILTELHGRDRFLPVFVITQYDTFVEILGVKALAELDAELTQHFSPTYRGSVYYSAGETSWQSSIRNFLLS